MITLEHLSKSYGRKAVLRDISLQLEPGMVHGLVGLNGAGKSTLFRCIAGLESFSGSVVYAGGKLKDVTGFLETHPFFMKRITGREYLALMCAARRVEVEDWKAANVFDLPLGKYASTYSTGMKKKLALNAILLQRNEVFLLDEPFNGVDLQSNLLLHEVLGRLRDLGKTVLLSSHIFAAMHEVCDRLYHLEEGRIVRVVEREDFGALEAAMRRQGLGKRIEGLDLG